MNSSVRSPDAELSDIMMEGCSLMSATAQGEQAMACFQKLIDRDPEFAEVRGSVLGENACSMQD